MTAHLIVTIEVEDHEALVNDYAIAAMKVVKKYGGEVLVRGTGAEVLEGDFGHDAVVVISKWPSREAIKAFWNSPEYQALIPARQRVSDLRAVIIGDD